MVLSGSRSQNAEADVVGGPPLFQVPPPTSVQLAPHPPPGYIPGTRPCLAFHLPEGWGADTFLPRLTAGKCYKYFPGNDYEMCISYNFSDFPSRMLLWLPMAVTYSTMYLPSAAFLSPPQVPIFRRFLGSSPK